MIDDFANWPTTMNRPPDPTITVLFGGLLDLCYRSTGVDRGSCEVAVNPSDSDHQLTFLVFEDDDPSPIYQTSDLPANLKRIDVRIKNNPPEVNFFKTVNGPLDRMNGLDNDFRWMLDLEGEAFYKEGYPKNRIFKSKLVLGHGTFFALKTEATFNRVSVLLGSTGVSHEPIGHVAKLAGADIELAANESVAVTVDGTPVLQLPRAGHRRYMIGFGNICVKNDEPCKFSPGHILESRRNDFRFHRDVLDLPTFRARYGLSLADPGNQVNVEKKVHGFPWVPFGTDRAPCMGTGFGQTDGFQ